MLNFSKTKIFAICLFCLFAIYFALPSFILQEENIAQEIADNQSPKVKINNFFKKILPDKKINLGLDLRGGSQLMIEVDFEYYLKEQIEQLRHDFSDIFTANSSFDNFCAKTVLEAITKTNRINFFIFNSILFCWMVFKII